MQRFKDYMGKLFKGKSYHVKCDCIMAIDFKAVCVDYEMSGNELILIFDCNGKRVRIGENHPNLMISPA